MILLPCSTIKEVRTTARLNPQTKQGKLYGSWNFQVIASTDVFCAIRLTSPFTMLQRLSLMELQPDQFITSRFILMNQINHNQIRIRVKEKFNPITFQCFNRKPVNIVIFHDFTSLQLFDNPIINRSIQQPFFISVLIC
jgi:hypothetical protein